MTGAELWTETWLGLICADWEAQIAAKLLAAYRALNAS